MASSAQLEALREALRFVPSDIAGYGHKDIAEACSDRGLPAPPPPDGHTKAERAKASFDGVPDIALPEVARAVLQLGVSNAADRNKVQDALWELGNPPPIPERTRREIASALDTIDYFRDFDRLLTLVDTVRAR